MREEYDIENLKPRKFASARLCKRENTAAVDLDRNVHSIKEKASRKALRT